MTPNAKLHCILCIIYIGKWSSKDSITPLILLSTTSTSIYLPSHPSQCTSVARDQIYILHLKILSLKWALSVILFSRESDSTTTNVRSFVCLSVRLSVRPSVRPSPKPPNSLKSIISPYHNIHHHSHHHTQHHTHHHTHNNTAQQNITTQHYNTTSQHNITSHTKSHHNITMQHHTLLRNHHPHHHPFHLLLERLLSFSACFFIEGFPNIL